MSPDLDALIRNMIVGSPLARLVGLEPVAIEADRVQVRLPFRSEVTTLGDLVHGGAIATLVDVTATAAGWSGADLVRRPRGTTIGLTINYLAGASGRDLVATGTIVSRGKSIVVCEVAVEDDTGAAVTRALVTYKLTHDA